MVGNREGGVVAAWEEGGILVSSLIALEVLMTGVGRVVDPSPIAERARVTVKGVGGDRPKAVESLAMGVKAVSRMEGLAARSAAPSSRRWTPISCGRSG